MIPTLALSLFLTQAPTGVEYQAQVEYLTQQQEASAAQLQALTQELQQQQQHREQLTVEAASLSSVGHTLEQVELLLVQGASSEASTLIRRAVQTLNGLGSGTKVSALLSDALLALDHSDNNRARGRVWEAAVALLDASGYVNTVRQAP